MTGDIKQGETEIPLFEIGIPSPVTVNAGITYIRRIVIRYGLIRFMTVRARMDMKTSPVPGDFQTGIRNKTQVGGNSNHKGIHQRLKSVESAVTVSGRIRKIPVTERADIVICEVNPLFTFSKPVLVGLFKEIRDFKFFARMWVAAGKTNDKVVMSRKTGNVL